LGLKRFGAAEFRGQGARVTMAVACAESLTNLLQPFFLLAVLPVMGAGVKIQARDLTGYVLVPFLALFVTIGLLVILVPVLGRWAMLAAVAVAATAAFSVNNQ